MERHLGAGRKRRWAVILGKIELKLTKAQTRQVRELWNECEGKSTTGSSFVLAQVAVKVGPFYAEPAQAYIYVMDGAGFERMQAAINAGKGGQG